MGGIVLMLHVANVACCNSHGCGSMHIYYGGATSTHCQRQRAEGEYVCNTAGQLFPNVLLSVSKKNVIFAVPILKHYKNQNPK